MSYRKERLNSVIKDTLSEIIAREVEFDGALVTITEIEISEDNQHATVLFSVIPSNKKAGVTKVLEKNAGEFQYRLMKKIPVRKLPRIAFKYDTGPEKASNVEKILIENKVEDEENNG